jgi:hypothetical protein
MGSVLSLYSSTVQVQERVSCISEAVRDDTSSWGAPHGMLKRGVYDDSRSGTSVVHTLLAFLQFCFRFKKASQVPGRMTRRV